MSLAQRQAEYAHARDSYGMTVEEFERAQGLPPFSVVPAARYARSPFALGWRIYEPDVRVAALAEEERQMACLRALGLTTKEIAALYDCRPPRQQRSDADGAEENRQMVCLRRLGLRLHEVGALFGLSTTNVWVRTKGFM